MQPRTCPVCHGTQLQNVSTIHRSGTWRSASTGASVGMAHVLGGGPTAGAVGLHVSGQSSQTDLAKLLSPPVRPKEVDPYGQSGILMGIAVVCSFVGVLFLITRTGPGIILGAFCLGCAGVSRIFASMEAQKAGDIAQHNRLKMDEWERKHATWERLVYCSGCDHVTDPDNPAVYLRAKDFPALMASSVVPPLQA